MLDSEFFPFDGDMLRPLEIDEMEAPDRRQFINLGKKSQELMAPLFRLMQKQEPWGEWDAISNGELHCGSSVVRIGRPHLEFSCFENDLTKFQLLLVPHLSARGPNGAWLLKRGSEHPDTKALANRRVFAVFSSGLPDVIYMCVGYSATRTIELYGSHQEAENAMLGWEPEPEDEMTVGEVSGVEVLRLLAITDTIQVGSDELALTWRGARYLEKELATKAEVFAILPVSGVLEGHAEA